MNAACSRFSALVLLVALLAACATGSPTSSPTPSPTHKPTASPTPTLEPTPTPVPLDQAMLGRRFTVLVAGEDTSQYRRDHGVEDWNTDALMVVSVSADKARIDVISLPRDTVDVPMANGTTYHGKINAISEAYGIEALRGAMSTLLGVPIDRYVSLDMDDFIWLVDAVGGVTVDVKTRISDAKVNLHLEPGPAHLDGAQALAFSRTRAADSDYARAARQQQVIVALAHAWLNPSAAALLSAGLRLGSLKTDIRLEELPTLLEIGRRSASATVTAIVLDPPRYSLFVGFEPNSRRGWVMIPDVPEMRRYARTALAD